MKYFGGLRLCLYLQDLPEHPPEVMGGRRQQVRVVGGTEPDDDDDDAVFGQLIVRELRHVTDAETKLLLRHNILTTIYEARLGCLQWPRAGSNRQPPRVQPPPPLSRLDRARPTVNGCWLSPTVVRSNIDAIESADVHLQNRVISGDGMILVKDETE